MPTRFVVAILVAAAVGFAVGGAVGSAGTFGVRVPTSIGDGFVGERVATVTANGTSYGVRDTVAWRDATGSSHESGWPSCLTPGAVTGVRFAGATVWNGDLGIATVLWVDCQTGP